MTLTLVLKKGFNARFIYVKYENSINDHSKAMANVKVFAEKTNGRAKNYIPPIYRCGGIKRSSEFCFLYTALYHNMFYLRKKFQVGGFSSLKDKKKIKVKLSRAILKKKKTGDRAMVFMPCTSLQSVLSMREGSN